MIPLIWITNHWTQLLAWAGAGVFFQRVYTVVAKVLGVKDDLTTLKLEVADLKENQLPHLTKELEQINANIVGLRETSRDGFSGLRQDLSGLRDDMRAIMLTHKG